MSEYKVIILPLAEEDIAEQADYIAFELSSPQTAINMVNGFKNAINNLSIFPRRKNDFCTQSFTYVRRQQRKDLEIFYE